MRLTPKPLVINEMDGFTEENDIFRLRPFGENLANLVKNIEEPLVISLDGPWGSGKSTFARQWAGLLRNRGMPVIVFDAFSNDYQENAFLAIAAEISSLAYRTLPNNTAITSSFIEKTKKAGRVLIPTLGKAAIRAASLGAITAAELDDFGEAVNALSKGVTDDAASLTEKLIEKRLTKVDEDRTILQAFRDDLTNLSKELGSASIHHTTRERSIDTDNGTPQHGGPLVFIVDELDRCRPTFALELLEQIKHLFSVDGVCFVFITHLPQIETVVRGHYGADMDASTYLEKFFHLRVTLPSPAKQEVSRHRDYIAYLWQQLSIPLPDPYIHVYLDKWADTLGLSLRSLERVLSNISIFFSAVHGSGQYESCIVAGLAVMHVRAPELFEKARSGKLTWGEARKFLQFDSWPDGEHESVHIQRVWRAVTDEKLDKSEEWAEGYFSELGLSYRTRHNHVSRPAILMGSLTTRLPNR